MKFSANLGFLWTDRALPDAIRAAHAAGFDAVECHWPYDEAPDLVRTALEETGLPMLGLNTVRGGGFGLSALPGREAEACTAVDQALDYAAAIGCEAVHVMAGNSDGLTAESAFLDTLRYAVDRAAPLGITLLIEPMNPFDAPEYFLKTCDQAVAIIDQVGSDRVRLMFDCYHMARSGFDVCALLPQVHPYLGHIQFAGVPDRGRPHVGTLDYAEVFATISEIGWTRPIGAEYRPDGATDDSLGWMNRL